MNNQIKYILATCYIGLLFGCGGGSSSTDTPGLDPSTTNPPTAGITRTGISAGTISNFGSIILNGVEYETDNSTFDINGAPGTQSDLKVGQYIVIKGSVNDDLLSGSADEVIFDDNVKGPVEFIDIAQNQLIVLGQTVQIDANTSFDDNITPRSIEGIAIDDILEVSGLVSTDGSISATRLDLQPAGTEFEVTGVISGLDETNLRFAINALTVDYSSAQLDNFPGTGIADGQRVESKGITLNASGELEATRVELKDQNLVGNDGDYIELEGFITRFVSATDFDVSGIPVTTSSSTQFEGGLATDLGLNIKVEVEGNYDANGVINASEVDIRRSKAVRITAPIDSIDGANNSITVLDIPITIDALTRLEDKSDAEREPLTLNDLNSGDFVEVRGSEVPPESGTVLATLLEREDADTEVELQGFVTSFSDPTIVILGVTIDTGSTIDFEDAAGNRLSRTEFFDQLEINSLVEASGLESSSNVITADEVEFEIE